MKLSTFANQGFERGRSAWVEGLWLLVRPVAFARVNPFNSTRIAALRVFGAKVGKDVVVKPGVRVKFPWRLEVGTSSWIGEDAWIDNLAMVTIGSDTCISQGSYLCTGNHDWRRESFDLVVKPIRIDDEVWLAARTVVGPGVEIGRGAIVTLGAVVTRNVPPGVICSPGAMITKSRVDLGAG